MREQGSLVEGHVNRDIHSWCFITSIMGKQNSLNATKMFSGASSWMRECKQITNVTTFKDHLLHWHRLLSGPPKTPSGSIHSFLH